MSLLVCRENVGRASSAWGSKSGQSWGWGLLCGTSGRRKLCMVPCHSYTYGIWRRKERKEVGKALKQSFGVEMYAIKRRSFYGKKEAFSLCKTAVLKIFTGYCKLFYRILPLFPILLVLYLFCVYWDWQGQECYLRCPKVCENTLKYSVW